MALVFTDSQIREITGQLINSKSTIKAINAEKEAVAKNKSDFLDLDNQESVYTNSFLNIIDCFHKELEKINGSVRTNYASSNIISSAKLEPGNPHFNQTYAYFKPLVLDSNNGLPITSVSIHETYNVDSAIYWIVKLINGFGSFTNTSYTGDFVSNVFTITGTTVPSFTNGQEVFLTDGINHAFGTVSSVTTTTSGSGGGGSGSGGTTSSTTNATVSINYSIGTLSGSISLYTGHIPTTDIMRASPTNSYVIFCEQILSQFVNAIIADNNSENNFLNNNDSKPDKSQIENSKTINNQFISDLNTWKAYSSKYSNSNLSYLQTKLNNRKTRLLTRISEISSSLGSVSINADTVTGGGRYLDLYNSICIRIHKARGYLRNYYQMDMIGKVQDEKIYIANALSNRDKDLFVVKMLDSDGANSDTIFLKDISSLNVGDNVMIAENTYNVLLRATITSLVQPNKVVLSEVVSSNYKTDNQARLIKNTN